MSYNITYKSRGERKAAISKGLEASKEKGSEIEFKGRPFKPQIVILPIDIPIYRMENCRTFSAQQSYIAKHNEDKEFFTKGQETSEIQQIQHNLLEDFLEPTTDDVKSIIDVLQRQGQKEEILISSSGVVINGNRRLCAMREILNQPNGSSAMRFEHVKCGVLPEDATNDDIEDIEAYLQATPRVQAEYDWIGYAHLFRKQIARGRTSTQIAERLWRTKAEIEAAIVSLDEADLYLSEWINKPGEYDNVKEGQQIFGDLPKSIRKLDNNTKDASRAMAWSIFENRENLSGRIYNLNKAFGELAPKALEIFTEEVGEDLVSDEESTEEEVDFGFEVDGEENEGIPDYTSIINLLKNDRAEKKHIEKLVFACETAIDENKGKLNKNAVLKAIVKINSKLSGLRVETAGEETLSSIMSQIKTMRSTLDKIEAEIDKRLQ